MSTAETDPQERSSLDAFVQSLRSLGWVEGSNLHITYRWGAGNTERMEANAREIVGLAPDVILAKGANVPAARRATSTIPTVFVVTTDVEAQNHVASFARPGGNITGFASNEFELVGKRLELLREIAPRTAGVLYIRGDRSETRALVPPIIKEAAAFDLAVTDGPAANEADIERAIEAFARRPDGGLVIAFDAFTIVHRVQLVDLAARYRLPAIYPFRFFTQSGGLVSYGIDQDDQFRQAASYVDRILKGDKPADLPVQQPTKFQLVINLQTAKALGITIPLTVLARADEVIE